MDAVQKGIIKVATRSDAAYNGRFEEIVLSYHPEFLDSRVFNTGMEFPPGSGIYLKDRVTDVAMRKEAEIKKLQFYRAKIGKNYTYIFHDRDNSLKVMIEADDMKKIKLNPGDGSKISYSGAAVIDMVVEQEILPGVSDEDEQKASAMRMMADELDKIIGKCGVQLYIKY